MTFILSSVLWREGPTDERFLRPLLHKAVTDIAYAEGKYQCDIPELQDLCSLHNEKPLPLVKRVLAALERADGSFRLVFLHTDAGGDHERARRERIAPVQNALTTIQFRTNHQAIAVIPVRETEAWMIADGDALRSSFGSTASNAELDVPARPRDVESILDPKAHLSSSLEVAYGGHRRRKQGIGNFYEIIGAEVRLSVLRQIPSFKRMETDLRSALRYFGLID
jgi:Domain of unknown function (DUF4276)